GGTLDEFTRAREALERRAEISEPRVRTCRAVERANLELRQARRPGSDEQGVELLLRLVVTADLEQGLGARERRVEAAAFVGRDAVGQEAGIDPEALGEPVDRLARGTGLAALDLADVLLREALPGQVALRHRRRDAQLAQPLSEPEGRSGGGGGASADVLFHTAAAPEVNLMLHQSASNSGEPSPRRGMLSRKPGEVAGSEI